MPACPKEMIEIFGLSKSTMSDEAKGKVNHADFVKAWGTVKPKGDDEGGDAARRLRKKSNGKNNQSDVLVDLLLSIVGSNAAASDGASSALAAAVAAAKGNAADSALKKRIQMARAAFTNEDQRKVDGMLAARDNGGKASIHYAAWRGANPHLDILLAFASDPVALLALPSTG